MGNYIPIRVLEFRLDISGEKLASIQEDLKQRGLPVRQNLRLDVLEYYRACEPDTYLPGTSEEMFVAACRMNEHFAGQAVDILRLESILEGEQAVGIRVFYRERSAPRARSKKA